LSFGHVRQLDRVLDEALTRAWRAGAGPGDERLVVAVDSLADGVELHFAEVKDPVKDRLKLYGLIDRLGPQRFHPTVGTAVDAYVAETGVEWRESDEEPDTRPGR
jgi:hypothetical protein